MDGHFRSYAEQSLHYFERPDEGVLDRPLDVPAAWRGREMAQSDAWRIRLSADHLEELDAALAIAKATGRPIGDLGVDDFPLPTLGAEVERWRAELSTGRGFLLVSGAPVARWGEADASIVFWSIGLHLGRPGAQNPAGDLLGHVLDTGEDSSNPLVRLYKTSADIAYHCDAADAVGLMCLTKARAGGYSRLASSVTVWNEIVRQRPDLAPRLFGTFALDIRNEETSGMAGWLPIPPCRYGGGQLRTFYHSDYFRSASRHADAPRLDGADLELLDLYEEIATSEEVRLDMDLEPGDIQLVSNHTVIHARTGYEDTVAHRRHLLRLWLSL